jgi:hypothetical protein
VRWAAPGIQLGIGPESADTLETTLVAWGIARGCLHLREISQPQVIHGCTHRTPCHFRPSISPTCVSIQAGWPQQQVMPGGGVLPYVAPAAVRRPARFGYRSDVQREAAHEKRTKTPSNFRHGDDTG